MYNKFENSGKVQNRSWACNYQQNNFFFKTGTHCACFHKLGKYCEIIKDENRYNTFRQLFIMKLCILLSPTDFDGRSCFVAF
jgi:hypothetical protein